MAPEQVKGEAADARSDQFSFCVALYEALYQQLPFAGDTFDEFAKNVLAENIRPPPSGAHAPFEIPILIEQTLRRGLSRDPEARFSSMRALIAALQAGLDPDSDSQRSRSRKRWAALTLIGCLLVIVAIRLGTLHGPVSGTLRPAMMMGWTMLLFLFGVVIALRRLVVRQPTYRRLMYFALVVGSYMTIGRTLGYCAKIHTDSYHLIEIIGVAALFAAEVPYAGRKYYWLVLICILSAISRVWFPILGPLHFNLVYALVFSLGLYLRNWRTQATSGSSLRLDSRDSLG